MSEVNIEGVNSETLDSLLRVDNLHKTYTTKIKGKKVSTYALRGISLRINRGEAIGIVGESGCGKSTLARILAGLEQPSRGSILFGNSPIKFTKTLRKKISMVFQDPYASLDPRMSTMSSIREPMHLLTKEELQSKLERTRQDPKLKNTGKNWYAKVFSIFVSKRAKLEKQYAKQLLADVQLREEWATRYPHEFSGGQRQRIGIARSLATSPELLILDEPVSALDVSVQAGIISLLSELGKENSLTMLFISHDLRIVKHVCDRIVVMYLGQVMESAPVEQLFSNPRHPYTRALISSIPQAKPKSEESVITDNEEKFENQEELPRVLAGEVPSPTNPPQGCPFRTRCEKATETCAQQPPLAEMTDGRLIACHFPY